jgi:hypothetical protein
MKEKKKDIWLVYGFDPDHLMIAAAVLCSILGIIFGVWGSD